MFSPPLLPLRLRGLFLLLLFVLPPLSVATAQAPAPQGADLAAIDRHVEAFLDATRVPGAAIALVQDGEIVHARGFGRADHTGRPMTAQTPTLVASVTKPLTALAILQLEEAGALALDDPVQRHIPWFAVADGPDTSARITIRHLLSHTSGLPSLIEGEYERVLAAPGPDDLEREVRHLRHVSLWSEPGARFQYSNVGYTTLGYLVEVVSGLSYEAYLQEHVYDPLMMTRSTVSKDEARADGLATGHRAWFGRPIAFEWSNSRAGLGGGFTYSTAEDLAHFATAQLEGGSYEGVQVLSAENIARMHAPAVQAPWSPDAHYGLGWFVTDRDGVRTVSHAGKAPNFMADVLLVPERDLAVVVLLTAYDWREAARFDALAYDLASIMMGRTPPPPPETGGATPSIFRALLAGDAVLLAAITLGAWSLRARTPRGRRLALAIPLALAGAAWALLALLVAPFFVGPIEWALFEVPDLGYTLAGSGVVGAACVALSLVVALRRPARTTRGAG